MTNGHLDEPCPPPESSRGIVDMYPVCDITGHWSVVMASVVFVIGNCNGEQVRFLIMKLVIYFIQFGFLCPFDILVCYEKRTKDFSLTQEGSE